jgi:hypothetical protein
VEVPWRFTHVRPCLYPDGGVARLRVHGEVVPDPRLLVAGAIDLAALEHGGAVSGCSDMFYSSPTNLISPGLARVMGEGWETARRRDGGNDWVELRLAGAGVVRLAELDTSWFVGNAPGWASLRAREDPGSWVELLPRTRLLPDTRHRFRVDAGAAATHVRLDIYPDGGMARVRLYGDLTPQARADLALRWLNLLPDRHARQVLVDGGLDPAAAGRLASARPLAALSELPPALAPCSAADPPGRPVAVRPRPTAAPTAASRSCPRWRRSACTPARRSRRSRPPPARRAGRRGPASRSPARAGLARVRDLHVPDPVGVALDGRGQVVAVDRQVLQVAEEAEIRHAPLPPDPVDGPDGVGGGPEGGSGARR